MKIRSHHHSANVNSRQYEKLRLITITLLYHQLTVISKINLSTALVLMNDLAVCTDSVISCIQLTLLSNLR